MVAAQRSSKRAAGIHLSVHLSQRNPARFVHVRQQLVRRNLNREATIEHLVEEHQRCLTLKALDERHRLECNECDARRRNLPPQILQRRPPKCGVVREILHHAGCRGVYDTCIARPTRACADRKRVTKRVGEELRSRSGGAVLTAHATRRDCGVSRAKLRGRRVLTAKRFSVHRPCEHTARIHEDSERNFKRGSFAERLVVTCCSRRLVTSLPRVRRSAAYDLCLTCLASPLRRMPARKYE